MFVGLPKDAKHSGFFFLLGVDPYIDESVVTKNILFQVEALLKHLSPFFFFFSHIGNGMHGAWMPVNYSPFLRKIFIS